jgi:undecaprenyl-diphosphatase
VVTAIDGPLLTALSMREACLLGVVQGLTEFLPVSSSGHLVVLQRFLAPMPPAEKLTVDVALHLGTLAAVVVYFRDDLLAMARGLLGRGEHAYARSWAWLLVLGTLPAAAVGLLWRHRIEAAFDSPLVTGACFLLTGTLLFLGSAVRGATRGEEKLGPRDALVVGCFQALALLPGVSRSGSTIAGALFRRARADVAARFSFLLSIPAIAGALAVEARSLAALTPVLGPALAIGVLSAAVTGFAAIAVLLRAVRAQKLHYFAYYCWALGAALLAGTLAGARL